MKIPEARSLNRPLRPRLPAHVLGLILGIGGVLLLSPATLLLRLIDTPEMTVIFVRGIFAFATLSTLWLWIRHRDGNRPGGLSHRSSADRRAELIFAAVWGLSAVLFIAAVERTLVANALIIFALIPLFASVVAFFWLRESPPLHTWLVIFGCLLALVFIFGIDIGSSHLLGDLFSFAAALLLGFNFCLLRRHPLLNPVRGLLFGTLLMTLIALPFADFASISASDAFFGALLGIIVTPGAYTLINYSCRFLQSAETGLIMLLEMPLGPLLVWAFLGEEPKTAIILAGVAILSLLILNFGLSLRQTRP